MIIVTGAAGFIGSCLISLLNERNHQDVLIVDDFSNPIKLRNLSNKGTCGLVHRDQLFDWMKHNYRRVHFLFHIGARTDTASQDQAVFDRLNLHYSQSLWELCTQFQIPMLYASSAATYGDGSLGYEDRHDIVSSFVPLNPYARSKNEFDTWALAQPESPPHWWGLKFFNVYGPNEYHKSRMASVVFHCYNQIKTSGQMRLFRSHRQGIRDGDQARDFVYIKDVVKICLFFMQGRPDDGLYNVGTGEARTFLDLTAATFSACEKEVDIAFIDTPVDIRDTYQYYTEADINKLRLAGYPHPFHTLEEGIHDYIKNYLVPEIWL